MNKKSSIITNILILAGIVLAQDEGPKFRAFGFADMSFSKFFMKENSFVRAGSDMSNKLQLSLSHINLYSDFTPNDHLRMLVELGYQQKPINQIGQKGTIFTIEGVSKDTTSYASSTPANSTVYNGESFEWGSFSIERAVFQLKLNSSINFTFGKFITPSSIWNVDHGSPAIMTIRQPTQFGFIQLFPKSQMGIMEEGTTFLGDADLSYTLYASTGRNQLQIEDAKDIAIGGQVRVNLPLLNECRIGVSGYTGINREKLEYMNITIDTATFSRIQQQAFIEAMGGSITMQNLPGRIQQLISEEAGKPDHYSFTSTDMYKYRENIISANLKLKSGRVGLQSELTYQMIHNQLNSDKQSNTLGFYGLASYDAIKKNDLLMTPYFCYEYIKMKDVQNNPSLLLAGPASGYNLYMIGVNTKIYTNFGFKLEFSYVDLLTRGTLKNYADDGDFPALSGQFNIAF